MTATDAALEAQLEAEFDGDHRAQRPDRAARLDARGLPQDPGAADRPARALRDHRHAAGGQLDHPGAVPAPQGDPAGQGAGRGRPRALPLLRHRDPRGLPRRAHRDAHRGPAEVLLDLQLPDAVVRRRRDHRLARRRRRDLQPGAAVPDVVRPLRAGDDPDLQGGVVPPAAGLRAADDDDARHRRAAGDGAGVGGPVLVAGADDVRPARRGLAQHRAVDGVGDQAQHQRRPAAAVRRHVGARRPRRSASRCPTRSCAGTRSAATTTSASRTGTSSCRWSRATGRATPSGSRTGAAPTRTARGCARRRRRLRATGPRPQRVRVWTRRRAVDEPSGGVQRRGRARRGAAQGAGERSGHDPSASGRSTRCSCAASAASTTCTSARCTRPTTRWRCGTRATSTPAATRASRSGW